MRFYKGAILGGTRGSGQRDRLVAECAQVRDHVDPFGLVLDTGRLHLDARRGEHGPEEI